MAGKIQKLYDALKNLTYLGEGLYPVRQQVFDIGSQAPPHAFRRRQSLSQCNLNGSKL